MKRRLGSRSQLIIFLFVSTLSGAHAGQRQAQAEAAPEYVTPTTNAKALKSEQERRLSRIQSYTAQMPSEWLTCHTSEDCGLVWYNFMEEAFAANREHSRDAQGVICRTEVCSWLKIPSGRRRGRYFATCERGLCQTAAGIAPSSACRQDSDCELIHYDCNQASAVNGHYLSKAKGRLCKQHDCKVTDCASFNHYDYQAKCMNDECVTQSSLASNPEADPGGNKWLKRFATPKASAQ